MMKWLYLNSRRSEVEQGGQVRRCVRQREHFRARAVLVLEFRFGWKEISTVKGSNPTNQGRVTLLGDKWSKPALSDEKAKKNERIRFRFTVWDILVLFWSLQLLWHSGRSVASNTRGPRFSFLHRQNFFWKLLIRQYYWKDAIKCGTAQKWSIFNSLRWYWNGQILSKP